MAKLSQIRPTLQRHNYRGLGFSDVSAVPSAATWRPVGLHTVVCL